MFLGISTYTFPWAVALHNASPGASGYYHELFQQAAENSIKFIQFGDNMPLHELPAAELQKINELAITNGICNQVGTRGLTVENIQRYIPIALHLGAKFIRVIIDDENYEPRVSVIKNVINTLLPQLKKSGIMLAIENHDRLPATLLEKIILDTDPEQLGICLDTVNSVGCGEGIKEITEVLAPYTINLHLKDFMIKRVDHKMGFTVEGTAAGSGMLDIEWLINKLQETGKCKTATLELWSNPLPSTAATLEQEKALFKTSISYLKQFLK